MKQLLKFFITAILLSSAFSANAVIVSLVPASGEIKVGDQLSLDVLYDIEGEKTVGGAFSVKFDQNAFDFVSFKFDANLPDDEAFRVSPDSVNSDNFNLGFGNLSGVEGSGTAGTLIFQAKQDGSFDFTLSDPLTVHDPFAEGASYVNAQVQVGPVNPVPLPGAAWLLLSGFAGLGLITRRKHSS